MKIIYSKSNLAIRNIVEEKAKYQKVMVIYDEFVSNLELNSIYSEIKDICIYNNSLISKLNNDEINNGYKVVVFLCCVDSYLKFQPNSEVVNIFCPQNNGVLPYFLSDNHTVSNAESYLILPNNQVDIGLISSTCFNQFFHYVRNVFECGGVLECFNNFQIMNEFSMQKILENLDKEIRFVDIEIMRKFDVTYNKLPLVDLIILDAFIILLTSIKNQQIMTVDFYKAVRENEALIDKFYLKLNDSSFANITFLNYNYLIKSCKQCKERVVSCLKTCNYTQEDVDEVVEKVKNFSKNDEGIISYLYLYNIFGV